MNGAFYWVAKGMQLFGLIVLPLGLYAGIRAGEFRAETWLAAIGVVVFYTGVFIERKTGRKPDAKGDA